MSESPAPYLPGLELDRRLQEVNTLAVPASARYYLRVSTVEQLRQALGEAQRCDLATLVLGGGSNVVLPEHFDGLLLHIDIKGFEQVAEQGDEIRLRAGAGESWQDLVEYCLERNYCGVENLSLIPGTVGAAPIQNIGAYGVELDSIFHELEAVDRESLELRVFARAACEFSYRDSVFKHRLKDRYVITSVTLRLSKTPRPELSYAPLQQAFAGRDPAGVSPREISEAVCRIRRSKLPDPRETPNAGSFFKNPIISRTQFAELAEQYPEIASYPVDAQRVKLAAAWLLDRAGWKGHREAGLGMHSRQALVLVNPGRRPAREVLAYAARIQTDIAERFGVTLEREPVSCGEGSKGEHRAV